jgi:RHS repeat-associated protein
MAAYAYDPSGRMTQVTLGDGTVGVMRYDALGNLDALVWTSPDGSVRSTEEVFASSGRVLQRTMTGPDGAATYQFGYDTNGRLTSANLDTPLAVSARSWAYEFDGTEGAAANRTAQIVDGRRITYSYDDQHRLTATDDPTLAGAITYDSRGNTTQLGPLSVTYGSSGQMASATDGSTTVTRLTDGVNTLGQQVTTTAGTSEIRFTAGGLQLDTDGRVVGRTMSLAPGVTVTTSVAAPTTWSLPDLRGNATWTISSAGSSPTKLFDPFGQQLTTAPETPAPTTALAPAPAAETTTSITVAPTTSSTIETATTDTAGTDSTTSTAAPTTSTVAPTAEPPTSTTTSGVAPDARPVFGWHGASGVNTLPLTVTLMEMGARTYVPALGRFLESDPVVNGGANPYAYANGDPVNGHDTTGTTDKWWAPLIGAVVAVVVGVVIGVATAGVGTAAAIGWGIAAAAIGGALGEVTTELINTGTVDIKAVGYSAAIDAALAAVTFGAARFFKGRQLAKAGAGRAGPIAADVQEGGASARLSTNSSMLNSEQYLAVGNAQSFQRGLTGDVREAVEDVMNGWDPVRIRVGEKGPKLVLNQNEYIEVYLKPTPDLGASLDPLR